MMNKSSKIYIAGHSGLAGSAIVRRLEQEGYQNLIVRKHSEVDLCSQAEVEDFFATEKPDYVFLAAAKVGGIYANDTYPADFIRDNIQIQTNVIDASYRHGVKKLLFLGSSCIYPKECPQPIKEEYLLTGPLEPTNEWYAIAKIAGIKMCQAYRRQYGFNAICVMPTNLYGPGDNYDLDTSHVLAALIRKFFEASHGGSDSVEVWGTGKAKREFLHVDDLASANLYLMQNYDESDVINVGAGEEIAISDLAEMIALISGFQGEVVQDLTKPDGAPRKKLNTSRILALGWEPKIPLKTGVEKTYQWYGKYA